MKYEKTLRVPNGVRKRVRLPIANWKEHGLVLNHLRAEGNALVLAEGTENAYTTDDDAAYLLSSDSELASYYPRIYRIRRLVHEHQRILRGLVEIADYVLQTGERIFYMLSEVALYYDLNGTLYSYSQKPGGYAMAIHKDRVFFAGTDGKLYWSLLYPERGFGRTGTQDSGALDLIDESLGKVVRLVSLGGNLVLFHERGLSRLEGTADTLTFRLVKVGFDYASVNAKSVTKCDGKIWFFTDRDLFVTDGVSVERVKNAAVEEIDASDTIYGATAGGDYYASVLRRDGTRQIYCYDRKFACGRFLALRNLSVASCKGVYLLYAGKVDLLQGSAPPEIGEASAVFRYDLCDGADGAELLESVEIEGRGMYEVCVTANGVTRRARGSAGKRLPLSGALRANEVAVEIKPLGDDFALSGVTLCKRREAVI